MQAMNSLTLNDLHLTTVKIQKRDGTHLGTGFFLTKTSIVTCYHIIRNYELDDLVFIWNKDVKINPVKMLIGLDDPTDIAIFEIPLSNQLKPLLIKFNADVRPFDNLMCYGYSDEFPEGSIVTMQSEGLTGDNPSLIKFKSGRIRPGLSGSPIYNIRTGEISGMVKFTFNRSFELGGGGVTVSTILKNIKVESGDFEKHIKIEQHDNYDILFRNKELIYVDAINTLEKSDDAWRWIQRVFKHRHPQLYLDFDLVDQDLDRTWWQKNNETDWIFRDWTHEQVGQYCLCPITEKVFYELSQGEKIESQISASDILSPNETYLHRFWYLGNFMKTRTKPGIPREVGVYLEKLMLHHIFFRALNSNQFATYDQGDISIIAFVEAASIKQFVQRNRFTKVFPHTTDEEKQKIYSSIWSHLLLKHWYQENVNWLSDLKQKISGYTNRIAFQQPPNY